MSLKSKISNGAILVIAVPLIALLILATINRVFSVFDGSAPAPRPPEQQSQPQAAPPVQPGQPGEQRP